MGREQQKQSKLQGREFTQIPESGLGDVRCCPCPSAALAPQPSSPHVLSLMALQARYHLCAAGWLDGQRVGYPTAFSSPNCGAGYVGIVDYGKRVNLSETWDVFCYREKGENGRLSLATKGALF